MSDNKAAGFLDDIIAHPDDDTPRLIFADWLDDHGQSERAEFIRLQIERAGLPEWDARQVRLRLREQELLKLHASKWKAALPKIKGVTWEEFRRGFLATAKFSTFAVFASSASACWAAAPVEAISVRWPRQDDASDILEPIAGLRELTIHGKLVDPRDVRRLAASPVLSTLRALNVRDNSIGPEGFDRIVNSPHLGNLTALRTPFNSIGSGGIDSLANSRYVKALQELDLSEAGSYGRYGEDPIIDADGIGELVRWEGLSRLRSMTLSGNEIGQAGLAALLSSPHCVGLKELVLRANGLRGRMMQAFEAAHAGLQLDVLDLGENLLRDAGIRHLSNAACLQSLKVLELDRCEIGMKGEVATRLAGAPFLASLRRLNLSHNYGSAGLPVLLAKAPPELHTLRLSDTDLTDATVAHLAESPASDTLLELDLDSNGLGDPAATALAKSKHLRNLLVLRLQHNLIDKSAATALARSPLGKRLAVLGLGDEEIPY